MDRNEEYLKQHYEMLKRVDEGLFDFTADPLAKRYEKKEERPTWKQTFFDVAKVIAKRSKDPHTKVGAVLVKNNCIIGTGYNGDPRNFKYKFNWNSPEKYDYVIHAEMNAIANACYNGCQIKDSEIYLTLSPCKECIKLLIQFGVKRVYFLEQYKDYNLTKHIAENSELELIQII